MHGQLSLKIWKSFAEYLLLVFINLILLIMALNQVYNKRYTMCTFYHIFADMLTFWFFLLFIRHSITWRSQQHIQSSKVTPGFQKMIKITPVSFLLHIFIKKIHVECIDCKNDFILPIFYNVCALFQKIASNMPSNMPK